MVALAIALLTQEPFHQTSPWREYQEKLQRAYAIEIQWTKYEAAASTIFHGQPDPRTRKFRLLFRKPDFILLEEPSVARTIWNGAKGIELDLAKKTWKPLLTKPTFEGAQFLYLPTITPEPIDSKLVGKITPFQSKGANWTTVSFQLHQVDAGSDYDYTFSDRTKLLSVVNMAHRGQVNWRGKVEIRIQMFDTDRMALTTDFPLDPPKGFQPASAATSG